MDRPRALELVPALLRYAEIQTLPLGALESCLMNIGPAALNNILNHFAEILADTKTAKHPGLPEKTEFELASIVRWLSATHRESVSAELQRLTAQGESQAVRELAKTTLDLLRPDAKGRVDTSGGQDTLPGDESGAKQE